MSNLDPANTQKFPGAPAQLSDGREVMVRPAEHMEWTGLPRVLDEVCQGHDKSRRARVVEDPSSNTASGGNEERRRRGWDSVAPGSDWATPNRLLQTPAPKRMEMGHDTGTKTAGDQLLHQILGAAVGVTTVSMVTSG